MATADPAFCLILMNIDGSQGQSFDIHGDVLIGRDKGCNVRIKLPSISRQHAKMSFDENGQVTLTHLSKTNPSFINGNRLTDTTPLSHGDLLAFGDRIFMFKQMCQETGTNELTIDRNNTKLDQASFLFSPRKSILCELNGKSASPVPPVAAEKKGLPTPLRKTIEARRKSGAFANSEVVISLPKSPAVKKAAEGSRLALPTPLRKSIISRCQSFGKSENAPPVANAPLLEMVGKIKTPSKTLAERRLPTPLRQGILQKRKGDHESSTVAPPTMPKSALKKRRESRGGGVGEAPMKQVNFNLQEAIVARKKTLRKVGTDSVETSSPVVSQPAPEPNPVSMKSLVPTPLRLAVARRRQILDQQEAAMATLTSSQSSATLTETASSNSPEMKLIKKRLFTPLRQDIAKLRRRSTESETVADSETSAEEVGEAIAAMESLSSSPFLSPVVEKVVAAITETLSSSPASRRSSSSSVASPVAEKSPAPIKALATPLRKAIQAKRKSFAENGKLSTKKSLPETEKGETPEIKSKGLATPLRRAIEAKRKSFVPLTCDPEIPSVEEKQIESQSMEVAPETEETVEQVVEEVNEEEIEPFDATETLVKDIITSQSLQITTDIVCNEALSTSASPEKLDHSIVVETIAEVLLTPQLSHLSTSTAPQTRRRSSLPKAAVRDASGLFSPVSPNNDRQTKHLLASIEKKSRLRYAEVLQTVSDRETYLTDLVSHLNDLDMEIIESYAQKLVETSSRLVIDEDDAFGVALDAYIRGIEIASQQVITRPEDAQSSLSLSEAVVAEEAVMEVVSTEEPSEEVEAEVETEDEGEGADDQQADDKQEDKEEEVEGDEEEFCYDYSDVLQQLFKLPRDYLDANSDELDAELVEMYADEICATAGVSSAVAYGIALDSYSSDPVQFRHYVGRLALPALEKIHFMESDGETNEAETVNNKSVEPQTIVSEEENIHSSSEAAIESVEVLSTPAISATPVAPVSKQTKASTAKKSVKKSTGKRNLTTPSPVVAPEPLPAMDVLEVAEDPVSEQVVEPTQATSSTPFVAADSKTVSSTTRSKASNKSAAKKSVKKSAVKESGPHVSLLSSPVKAPEALLVTYEVEGEVSQTNVEVMEVEEVEVTANEKVVASETSATPAKSRSAVKTPKASTAKRSSKKSTTQKPVVCIVDEVGSSPHQKTPLLSGRKRTVTEALSEEAIPQTSSPLPVNTPTVAKSTGKKRARSSSGKSEVMSTEKNDHYFVEESHISDRPRSNSSESVSEVDIPIGVLSSEVENPSQPSESLETETAKSTPKKLETAKGRKRKSVEEDSVVAVPVEEVKPSQAAKRRRGATTKLEEEPSNTEEMVAEEMKEAVQSAPVKKGRGKAAAKIPTIDTAETVVAKDAPVAEEEKKVESEVQEDAVVESAPKKVGRGGKRASAKTTETTETITTTPSIAAEVEEATTKEPVNEEVTVEVPKVVAKKTRGRKTASTEEVVEDVPEVVEEIVSEVKEVPAKKPVRGGRAKKVVVEEETVLPEPEPVVEEEVPTKKVTRGGRGKKEIVEEVVEAPVEVSEKEEEKESPAKKPVKSGRGKKASAEVETVIPLQPEPVVEEKVPRGGRGKKGATVEEPVEVEKEEEEEKQPPVKKPGGRGKKAAAAPELVEEAEIPVEEEPPVKTTKAARGKKAAVEKETVKEEESNKASRSGRAGRQAKSSKPSNKKEEEEVEVEEEEEEEIALAILCDGCDEEYFVDEIRLKKIPKGKWFCAKCTAKPAAKTATRKGKK